MATTTIPWGDGSGDNIYLTADALEGDQTVLVSSDANTSVTSRTQTVTFSASGVIPVMLTITQEGDEPMEWEEYVSASKLLHLSSYDSTDKSYYGSVSNPSYAYTDTSSANMCQVSLTRGSGAYTYIYFKFNTSTIPSNARIDSVECKVKANVSSVNTSYIASSACRMCSGTTYKTNSVTMNTGTTVRTFGSATWTRDEVSDMRIKMEATRGTSNVNSNYYLRMYGADLTINYSVPTTYYRVKVKNGVSGLTVSPMNEGYASGTNATLTFSGLSSGFVVLDNGVDVTSQLVSSGGDLTYTITGIAAGHIIECNAI